MKTRKPELLQKDLCRALSLLFSMMRACLQRRLMHVSKAAMKVILYGIERPGVFMEQFRSSSSCSRQPQVIQVSSKLERFGKWDEILDRLRWKTWLASLFITWTMLDGGIEMKRVLSHHSFWPPVLSESRWTAEVLPMVSSSTYIIIIRYHR